MGASITFLGHAGFILADGKSSVAVDPFLTDNPIAKHKAEDIDVDYIALTHGHFDHIVDTPAIAKRTGATVVASFEICNYLSEQGIENVEPGNPGGTIKTDFGSVTFTHAFHSSSHDGRYMGMPCGLVISIGGMTFYHLGDTGLFGDLAMLGELYKPDVAAVPIGDRFTMDAKLGTRAAEMVGARYAIPIHFKTFPLLAQDSSGFEPVGVEVKELAPGETWEFS